MPSQSLIKQSDFSDATRYVLSITPYGTTELSLAGQNETRFRFPRQDFNYGMDNVLNFNGICDGDGNSDDEFMNNIVCVFDQFRGRVDGGEVQSVRKWGHLQCIDDNLRWSAEYRTGFGAICQGAPALSSSGTVVRYGLRLLYNCFFDRILPLYKIGQVELEILLNTSVAQYTTATTAVTSVVLNDFELQLAMIKSPQMTKYWNENEIISTYFDYDHHVDTALLSGATSHTTIVPTSNKSLDGILVCMRNTADVNDPNFAGNGRYESAYVTNALTRLSFIVDGVQLPRREINTANQTELYQYLLEYAGHKKGSEFNAPSFFNTAYSTATDGQFVIAYPFNSHVGSDTKLSGLNTSMRTGQIEIRFSAMTASVNTQIDIWTRYSKIVKFTQDGQVLVTK